LPTLFLLDDSYTFGSPVSYSYSGDGTSGVYIYGAQLEALSYPTSYIRSEAGGTVTRSADAVTGAGDATTFAGVNSSGVLYWDMARNYYDGLANSFTLSDGSNDNRIRIYYSNSAANTLVANFYVGGVDQLSMSYLMTDETDFNKIAFRWAENDFGLWVNGTEVATDASGSIFPASTLTQFNMVNVTGNDQHFFGKTKSVAVYPYLTDEEMENLTTP